MIYHVFSVLPNSIGMHLKCWIYGYLWKETFWRSLIDWNLPWRSLLLISTCISYNLIKMRISFKIKVMVSYNKFAIEWSSFPSYNTSYGEMNCKYGMINGEVRRNLVHYLIVIQGYLTTYTSEIYLISGLHFLFLVLIIFGETLREFT